MKLNQAFLVEYIQYAMTKDAAYELPYFDVQDWCLSEEWGLVWELIEEVCNYDVSLSNDAIGFIAAGPLEDLLSGAGPEFIEPVIALAKKNSVMGKMLTGVWQSQIPSAVWPQVVEFCSKYKDPIDGVYRYGKPNK